MRIGIDIDDNNIYLDTDELIVSGTPYTQNTWMDAKYAGIAVYFEREDTRFNAHNK